MMPRLIVSLVLPLLLVACGDADRAPSTPAADTAAPYREGQHYHRLGQPLSEPAADVVEVFSYACPACAQFQPQVDAWKRARGDAASLRYVPAEFFPHWVPWARAFHATQAMGVFGRTHRGVFDAIYRQGRQATTIEQIADVLAGLGIDRARFLEIAYSPDVEAALQASRDYVRAAGVSSTPSLIVAGRYRVEPKQPGGGSTLDVADWLLANKP